MGSEIKNDEVFDSRFLDNFKAGDLVSWQNLGEEKEYGFIMKIYYEEMSKDRKFMFAKVKKPDGNVENFMLSSLKKESQK